MSVVCSCNVASSACERPLAAQEIETTLHFGADQFCRAGLCGEIWICSNLLQIMGAKRNGFDLHTGARRT